MRAETLSLEGDHEFLGSETQTFRLSKDCWPPAPDIFGLTLTDIAAIGGKEIL